MTTLYEQPLNERIRTFLRLEHLFIQLHYMRNERASVWHYRALLGTLVEILNVFDRADIKTEFLKELDRLKIQLTKLFKSPNVDGKRLQEIIQQIDTQAEILQNMKGRIGQSLREHELITAIKHRLPIPGGTCSFDLPQLHYWLNEEDARRNTDIAAWIQAFKPIEDTTRLILELIRNSAYKEEQNAVGGFFQKSFDGATPCQIVRVTPHVGGVFPEISGGKHRISIRFLRLDDNGHPVQIDTDVGFTLICCMI
jgi:cell division protein ZapD